MKSKNTLKGLLLGRAGAIKKHTVGWVERRETQHLAA